MSKKVKYLCCCDPSSNHSLSSKIDTICAKSSWMLIVFKFSFLLVCTYYFLESKWNPTILHDDINIVMNEMSEYFVRIFMIYYFMVNSELCRLFDCSNSRF